MMRVHLIGIGGVAVAALAAVYKQKGYQVQGSDLADSEITETVRAEGGRVFIGHNPKHITKNIDLVVFSEAVPPTNPELQKARALGLKCQPAAQAIAELSQQYFTIAVSGMHGKTTTCSMIAEAMTKAGLDPSFIIGTKNGGRLGKSPYLVIEADDYRAKFLNYEPKILVLTNIDEEHMEYFRDLEQIKKVFKQYVSRVKDLIIANKHDENIREVVKAAPCKVRYYSASHIALKVPGRHNQYNAGAALEVLKALGIKQREAERYLSQYQGTWRRFQEHQIKINNKNITLIIDYGHHPTEIQATIKAAREKFPKKKIWLVFQPHQYQRTLYLRQKFVRVFEQVLDHNFCDKLILTNIYEVPGREDTKIKQEISSKELIKEMSQDKALFVPRAKVIDFLTRNSESEEVIIMMGAGDIYELSTGLVK